MDRTLDGLVQPPEVSHESDLCAAALENELRWADSVSLPVYSSYYVGLKKFVFELVSHVYEVYGGLFWSEHLKWFHFCVFDLGDRHRVAFHTPRTSFVTDDVTIFFQYCVSHPAVVVC